jgi:nucleolar protein 56
MDEKKLREKFIKIAKERIKEKKKRNDLYLIQLSRTLEDLTKVYNKLEERLSEFGYIYDINTRGKKLIEEIKNLKEGNEWINESEKIMFLKRFSLLLEEIENQIKEVERLIEKYAKQIMPNSYALIGGKLVAKYLSLAGSLEKLALMPSSTIQVLGAEKALFRHLRKRTKPPKHGILLLTNYVSSLPKNKRGKMARTLAAKLAIAFKADLNNINIADKLKADVEKRFSELKQEKKK